MKKFLALLLALVMTMSLVTVGASAKTAFTDDKDITEVEAVEVLSAMGIIDGYKDGSFKPQGALNRAAGAKFIAYLMLGEKNADGLKATGTVFEDVAADYALAPYVEWCAKMGIVDGYGDGKFGPTNTLTQAAFGKMLLTALGYDSAKEGYTGAGWQKAVYADGLKAGVYGDDGEIFAACNRETAAKLALGALKATMVEYDRNDKLQNVVEPFSWKAAKKAADTNFTVQLWETYKDLEYKVVDANKWGRPGHKWVYGDDFDKTYLDEADLSFTVATDFCEICDELGEDKAVTLESVWTNGVKAAKYAGYDKLSATDTKSTVGAQGQLVEFYDMGTTYRMVVVDTYLAKVTKVTEVKLDKHDHVEKQATITLDVFGLDGTDNVVLTSDDNYSYAKKDYVLVNVNLGDGAGKAVANTTKYAKSAIVGLADSKDGKFTGYTGNLKTGLKAVKVDGEEYDVAVKYALEGANVKKTYTWFFDQYGNVIGKAEVENTYTYGVIDSIQWINPQGANGYAEATLVYMDGSKEEKAVVTYVNGNKVFQSNNTVCDPDAGQVSVNKKYNAENGNHLYQVLKTDKGEFELAKVGALNAGAEFDHNEANFTEANHTELTNATVKTGVSAIRVADPTKTIYTNDDTVYLVETYNGKGEVTGYESVTGFNKISDYTHATVDYVLSSGYAKYVFIKGQADNAVATKLFFVTSVDFDIDYNSEDEVYYFSVTGILDGEKNVTLKVDVTNDYVGHTRYFDMLKLQRMYYVTFAGDYVTKVDEVAQNAPNAWNHYEMTKLDGSVYDDLYIAWYLQETEEATVAVDVNVLNLNGFHLNITNATTVFGDLADIDEDCNIFVIYDDNDHKIAKAVYVGDYVTYAETPTVTVTADKTPANYATGDTVTLTATVTNAADCGVLSYQWFQGDTALNDNLATGISGATTSTLVLTGVTTANSGSYTCKVWNYDTSKDLTTSDKVTSNNNVTVTVAPVYLPGLTQTVEKTGNTIKITLSGNDVINTIVSPTWLRVLDSDFCNDWAGRRGGIDAGGRPSNGFAFYNIDILSGVKVAEKYQITQINAAMNAWGKEGDFPANTKSKAYNLVDLVDAGGLNIVLKNNTNVTLSITPFLADGTTLDNANTVTYVIDNNATFKQASAT